jgi:hypothetical protein
MEGVELVENSLHYVSYFRTDQSGTDLSVISLATYNCPYVSAVCFTPCHTNVYFQRMPHTHTHTPQPLTSQIRQLTSVSFVLRFRYISLLHDGIGTSRESGWDQDRRGEVEEEEADEEEDEEGEGKSSSSLLERISC